MTFRAWDLAGRSHDSAAAPWPGGESGGSAPPAAWGFSVSPNVNEYWVEVTITPPSGSTVTKVEAIVDWQQWEELARTSWGSYARGFRVRSGASVVFRAWDQAGRSHDSAPRRW